MGTLTRIARGAAGVLAVVAYQVGAHYAAATPGAHGFGLALAIAPLLAIALAAAVRSAHRARLLPLWALVCARAVAGARTTGAPFRMGPVL